MASVYEVWREVAIEIGIPDGIFEEFWSTRPMEDEQLTTVLAFSISHRQAIKRMLLEIKSDLIDTYTKLHQGETT